MCLIVDDALGDFRFVILSFSILAGVALSLTAIGLYRVLDLVCGNTEPWRPGNGRPAFSV